MTVAKNIGEISIPVNENHPSILEIKENLTEPSSFEFKTIKKEFISKQINKLSLKKATGCDGILAKTTILEQISNMINLTHKSLSCPTT